jgi:transcription elongation factor Elf1
MGRKRRNPHTKKREREREREFNDADCPEQQKSYCSTYHKIDKGDGTAAKYDISTDLSLICMDGVQSLSLVI